MWTFLCLRVRVLHRGSLMPIDPRPLPAPLATALARAAATGECEARVPMDAPPPSETEFHPERVIAGRWVLFTAPGVSQELRLPLIPGEMYQVECRGSALLRCHNGKRRVLLGHSRTEGARWSPWRECSACHGTGYLDLRILSVTPERGCETCGGRRPVEENDWEKCDSCGKRYPDIYWADEAQWEEVAGDAFAGLRCPECFTREAREAGLDPKLTILAPPLRSTPCPTCHGTPGWVDWLVRFEATTTREEQR